jgi:lipid A oxidase
VERLILFFKALILLKQKGAFSAVFFFSNARRIVVVRWFRFFSEGYPCNLVFFVFVCFFIPTSLMAETSLEVYGGYQTSPHSVVSGDYIETSVGQNSPVPFKFTAAWKGNSFSMPPYYGFRVTNWNMNKGWGLDFNHSKAYADSTTLLESGFSRLQFTDGLNNLTIHRQVKIEVIGNKLIPYYGYGIGIIIPHVEVQTGLDSPLTFEYQYGGPTVALNAGFKLPLKKNRFFFTEYKFTSSWLDVTLNGGGGISTRIFTNALNVGLGFDF